MKKAIACLLVVMLAGCSATAMRDRAARRQSRRIPSPSQPLSTFSDFELLPMVLTPQISRYPEEVAAAKEFEARLRAKLLPLLEQWKADGGESPRSGGTLLIQPRLVSFRITSPASSLLDLDLLLTDGKTGAVIACPRIQRMTEPHGVSFRAEGRAQMGYAVEIVWQYLADHYK
jgi:hypothetical protein